jgi:hypothetical protein
MNNLFATENGLVTQLNPSQTKITQNNISTTEQVDNQPHRVINGMDFVSIQNETMRYYDVPVISPDKTPIKGGTTVRVTIKDPEWLFVRPSGAHTVLDNTGATHYIPANFVHLVWFKKASTEPAEF